MESRGVLLGGPPLSCGGCHFLPHGERPALRHRSGSVDNFEVQRFRLALEDLLHFRMVNKRFTGVSIGLVNYTARLKGVQLGLTNYAGNNPRWLRLLPLVNVHL